MSELFLPSLEISGYRGLRHLVIPKLGRVNLIVGKNNVGKTSLLEALWLYTRFRKKIGLLSALTHLLLSREEIEDSSDLEGKNHSLRHFFSGRKANGSKPEIQIGCLDSDGNQMPAPLMLRFDKNEIEFPSSGSSRDAISFHDTLKLVRPTANEGGDGLSIKSRMESTDYIEANGLSWKEITYLWDRVSLTPHEEDIVKALKIIDKDVARIGFIGESSDLIGHRIPMVLLEGENKPIPLRSAGEGMNKLLGITLALVNANDSVLLIDEVESGLHYSIQYDMWRLIFATARELNVQVFATTHSWDCVEAFQQAAVEDAEAYGMLIRLEAKGEETKVTLFDERRLSIATKEHIEVR